MNLKAASVKLSESVSKSKLRETLTVADTNYCLDASADGLCEFFALTLKDPSPETAVIGICSNAAGLKPKWVLRDDLLIVGYNNRIAVFNAADGKLKLARELDLVTIFFEFLETPESPWCVVLGETAVVALSPTTGVEQWRVDTDIITGFTVVAETLKLRCLDSPSVEVDLVSGRRLGSAI